MDWKRIRYVPVEDQHHHLLGLITHRQLLRLISRPGASGAATVPAHEVMKREVCVASPEMSALAAIQLMRRHRVGCLPVVQEGKLVGIVTENDFLGIAGQLLEEELSG